MAVEFVTNDAEAVKQVRKLYESAEKHIKEHNGEWAVLGQVYLHPHGFAEDATGVRVRARLLPPKWAQEINVVLRRLKANDARAAKRRAKKGK